MTRQDQAIQEIEVGIEEAKEIIALRDSLDKLRSNPDFKKVINKAYFQDEAVRLVMAKSSPMEEAQLANIDKMMYGIGSLAQFLDTILRNGDAMEQSVKESEQAREEILREGLD
jgi:putative N-acetylmannosamine-6-phosphate epimerase